MPTQQYRTDHFNRRLSALKAERESFIGHWKELAEFIRPRKGRFFVQDRNKGDRRYNRIINSKGTQAAHVARSGLLAGVMSPSRPWFDLGTADPDLREFQPVKLWLAKVVQIMSRVFNESNLYNMAPAMIDELLVFGTGCMTQVDDFDDVARFYTHTAGSYMIAQDERLKVNTLAREFEWTVEQIVGKWGLGNVSPGVKNAYDAGNYSAWYPVVHIIEPNPDADPRRKFSKFKPVRQVYYEPGCTDKDRLLEESGFDEFPAYAPRWDLTGEDVYATDCPAMTALGDIKGLQIQERRAAQAVDKMVNPPLHGPASLRNTPVSSLPGDVTVYDQGQGEGLRAIYQTQPRLNEHVMFMEKTERRIDSAFYVDLFKAITNMEGIQPRNEFDLMQRNQERLLQLGPVLERLHGEFLSKMIDRTFNQLARAKVLPEAPPELQGQALRVDYISTLAMAQRAVATNSIDRLVAFIGGLAQTGYTEALDKFNADQAVDEYASVTGVSPKLIVPDNVVAKRRQERMKQEQQAQAMEMAAQAANTAKMASDAKTDDASLLTAMTGKQK